MINDGHPPQEVWGYTPGQATAFVKLAEKRNQRQRAHQLSIAVTAARGKPDDIKQMLKEWNAD